MISICPFIGKPCRGPECPMLCYLENEKGRFDYFCGLNAAIPKECIAEQITPARREQQKGDAAQ